MKFQLYFFCLASTLSFSTNGNAVNENINGIPSLNTLLRNHHDVFFEEAKEIAMQENFDNQLPSLNHLLRDAFHNQEISYQAPDGTEIPSLSSFLTLNGITQSQNIRIVEAIEISTLYHTPIDDFKIQNDLTEVERIIESAGNNEIEHDVLTEFLQKIMQLQDISNYLKENPSQFNSLQNILKNYLKTYVLSNIETAPSELKALNEIICASGKQYKQYIYSLLALYCTGKRKEKNNRNVCIYLQDNLPGASYLLKNLPLNLIENPPSLRFKNLIFHTIQSIKLDYFKIMLARIPYDNIFTKQKLWDHLLSKVQKKSSPFYPEYRDFCTLIIEHCTENNVLNAHETVQHYSKLIKKHLE